MNNKKFRKKYGLNKPLNKYSDQELIDRLICPECYSNLHPYNQCYYCFKCGFSVC